MFHPLSLFVGLRYVRSRSHRFFVSFITWVAVLGVALGVVVALMVSAIGIPMAPPPNSESGFVAGVQVVPGVVGAAFVAGLVASVIAALLPARYISRLQVVEALRRGI